MGGLVGHSKECIFSSDCKWKPLGRDRTWWISRDHCGFSAENGEGSSERILWTFIFLHHKRKQIVAWARIRLSHLIVYLNIWSVDLGVDSALDHIGLLLNAHTYAIFDECLEL